jgi:hypothetical protein
MCYRPILLKTLYHYSFTLKSPCPLSSLRTLCFNWISWVKSILWLSGSRMYPGLNLAQTTPSSEATQRPPTHQYPLWLQYIFLLLSVPNNSQLLFLGCKAQTNPQVKSWTDSIQEICSRTNESPMRAYFLDFAGGGVSGLRYLFWGVDGWSAWITLQRRLLSGTNSWNSPQGSRQCWEVSR